ncbi:unnamed protein product, partial [Prunus brigantina]
RVISALSRRLSIRFAPKQTLASQGSVSTLPVRLVREKRREKSKMRKFDPWPVFFKREWNRNWPFLIGFAITGTLITKFSLGLTEEDAKNSPFVQRH